MTAYSQGDPRQKIQLCDKCNQPTGNCEEDSIYIEAIDESRIGPLCSACYDNAQIDPLLEVGL